MGSTVDKELHEAVESGNIEIIKLLLEKGSYINLKTKDGKTPLHIASRRGHSTIIKLLIENGIDINIKNKSGQVNYFQDRRTSIHEAAYKGHLKIVKLLLKKGSEINLKDKVGRIPLHFAVSNGNIEIVKLLVEKGSKINLIYENGKTINSRTMKKKSLIWISFHYFLSQKGIIRTLLRLLSPYYCEPVVVTRNNGRRSTRNRRERKRKAQEKKEVEHNQTRQEEGRNPRDAGVSEALDCINKISKKFSPDGVCTEWGKRESAFVQQ